MPTYGYQCSKCEHYFEDFLKMDNRKIPESQPCPNCKEENTVTQQLSAPALVSPISLGLIKPQGDFRDRMTQIKENHKHVGGLSGKIKDY